MLADNIMFLRKNYPALYQSLKENEEEVEESSLILEETKNKCQTLKMIKGQRSLYLHSKYDPLREAETIISQLEEKERIDEETHVIFYGLGLGYHIDAFVKRYPDSVFSLYEPSAEIFEQFLNYKNLKEYKEKKIFTIQCETRPEASDEFFTKFLEKNDKKIVIVDLPSYQTVFKEEKTRFFNQFIELVKGKRSSLETDLAFQQRWIFNSAINLKEVLNTPNILMQKNDIFKGKIGILVAAGPSLNEEIENLRIIKEKGLAYIFSVGSAINTLLHYDILPDAMCTYDPTKGTVFEKVITKNIKDIPMIFGSSVYFETIQEYEGPKLHMITSQDTIGNYFLRSKNKQEIKIISDAASIAVVTLQLLELLEFSTIILVGQNFAYKDKKNYADGIEYQFHLEDQNEKNILKTKDVLGNEVFTRAGLNSARNQMENYLKTFKTEVINTTVGGAHIEGTKFLPMKNVLADYLTFQRFDKSENAFKMLDNSEIYDKKYLKKQMKKMYEEYEHYQTILFEINQYLIKIKDLLKNKNVKQGNNMYVKVDQLLIQMESNDFFKIVVNPVHRVEYEILANKIQNSHSLKNEFKKLNQLIIQVENIIVFLYRDKKLNQDLMELLLENTKDEILL